MSSKFDTIFVANVAALALEHLAPLGDGSMAWVQSVKRYYSLDKSSGLAPDGITIIQPVTGSPIAGVPLGRWIAQDDGTSFATQAAWWIDPVGGNDQNAGLTALAPIKTWAELMRRIDGQLINQPTVISIMNDVPGTDPVRGTLNVGPLGTISIVGTKTPTALRTGTFTSVTTLVPATNTPQVVADAALPVSWSASGCINTATSGPLRMRITGGPNAGALAWAWAEPAAKSANTTPWIVAPATIDDAFPFSSVAPLVGDPYVVETDFVSIENFGLVLQGSGAGAITPSSAVMFLRDIDLSGFTAPFVAAQQAQGVFVGAPVLFSGCDTGSLQNEGQAGITSVNCKSSGPFTQPGGPQLFFGGLITSFFDSSGFLFMALDTTIACGGQLSQTGAVLVAGSVGVFDAFGEAIVVSGGANATHVDFFGPSLFYGLNPGGGVGIHAFSGSKVAYLNKPVLTGAGGDTNIGGAMTAYGAVPFFNPANGAAIVVDA